MPAKFLPFSRAEYARRLAKVRKAMAERDIHVLFVEDPSNMAWITGYDGWSFYVHQGVIVFHDEDPLWWGRSQDANGALRTVWMGDERVAAYADHYVQSTVRHPMQTLAALLRERGYGSDRIGVELENYYFSAKAYLTLQAEMPEASFVDATALVNWQRAVKSAEEIAFMRKAARISEKVIDGIVERAEPGLRKVDLVADIYADAIRGVGEDWGDYPAIVPLLPSGADAAAPHLTWDGRPLAAGEATFFEISGCYRRYHAPFCRTVFLGEPPQYLRDAESALVEGLGLGLEAARAGNRAQDVARALAGPLERAGIDRAGARAGYPIGLSYPPDWGERTISIRDGDETVLEPGMTFHFMPGLWMDNWGLEITESILIQEHGPAECLCDRPRQLIVKR
ncbi:M24 family metallopeptidase [Polymorphum gilvum]|uniref:Peptidase, M24 family protein n=1 Tax=Polymorphum gilvum (strain LMG 25793 / CGMCC 1.9160 / SL003B-26A1) TaxID=991905 RepID=F2J4C8_POLGS|nr:M24 family metallopeptidase [Polymorphum gilvum]ADZ71070.1 Peptidase, M24 family protein [Polymorphum gilvum SL003B-26A1]